MAEMRLKWQTIISVDAAVCEQAAPVKVTFTHELKSEKERSFHCVSYSLWPVGVTILAKLVLQKNLIKKIQRNSWNKREQTQCETGLGGRLAGHRRGFNLHSELISISSTLQTTVSAVGGRWGGSHKAPVTHHSTSCISQRLAGGARRTRGKKKRSSFQNEQ